MVPGIIWIRRLLGTLIVVLMPVGPVAADNVMPGKGVVVKPARATWTTGFFLEALYRRALEHLGYQVKKPKELTNQQFYPALMNGEVDFWANGWFPLHQALLPPNFGDKAALAGTVVKRGGLQGYMVDKASADKLALNSMDDFKRPEVKAAFDADGDGRADLIACQTDWACAKVTAHHLQVYGLESHINVLQTNYLMDMAGVLLRYQMGDPVLFYNWTPNWTIRHLIPGEDVVWLNVPSTVPTAEQQGLEAAMVQHGLQGAVTDSIRLGFVANDIRVVANKTFLDQNRAAKRLFAVMSIPLADITAQSYRMFTGEYHQEDIERHVNEWIGEHQDLWGQWLGEAQAAAR